MVAGGKGGEQIVGSGSVQQVGGQLAVPDDAAAPAACGHGSGVEGSRMKTEITENGEDELYNNIEFPLAQVLADMTRTGILVDREGIEAFGDLRLHSGEQVCQETGIGVLLTGER